MKILTAMYTMRRGGAYDRFIMMLEAFLERGCEVNCLSLTPIPVNHPGYRNHVLRIPERVHETYVAKVIVLSLFPIYLLWIGRREKIDLFIAFGSLYAFIEGIPKLFLRKPMVTFLRGNFILGMQMQGHSGLILWGSKWIEKIGILLSDTILSVNPTIQEEVRRATGRNKGQRWEVLPNNISPIPVPPKEDISLTRKRYGIPEDAKILVTAGVINRGKNVELLIRSLPEIGQDNLFLLIVGNSSTAADSIYKMELKKLVVDLELSDRVLFKEWIAKEQLWEIFRCSDLFVLPSRMEGMPNVMLEALGCDLPCLGSNISGIRDILQHDELIFDPHDDKALMNKMQQFFTGWQVFDKVTRLCHERKVVFNFDWKERVFEMITRTPSVSLGRDS